MNTPKGQISIGAASNGMEIRPIKKSEWDKLKEFSEAEYKPGHILTNKVYYDWQFDNFANRDKQSYSTIGLFGKSGELLGTFGMFLLPYNFYGKTVVGNCLANLIVKKNLRSLGYGYLLLDKAGATGDLAIDHTINEAAWPMFMKAGWQGEDLRRYLYIINPKTTIYELPASPHKKVALEEWHFDQVNEFVESVDVFWGKIKSRYPIAIERTSKYLNWRYAKNPLIQYKIFIAKNGGQIKAVAIMRVEEPRMDKPLGVKVGRLIDFFSDEEGEAFALDALTHYCRENKIDFIDYFTSGDFHKKGLKEAGFVYGDEGEYETVPILFNPVSLKRKRLNFAVKIAGKFSLSDCYTTKGGGDQDRAY